MSDKPEGLDSQLLAWAASRAAEWTHLLSSVIRRYQQMNDINDEQLCAMLACDRDALNHLRLCARPDPNSATFAIDVKRMADRFGVDAGKLAAMIRSVDALIVFGRVDKVTSPPPFSGTAEMLRAARDREDQEAGPGDTTAEQEPPPPGTEAERRDEIRDSSEDRDDGGAHGGCEQYRE